jgi:hypothetical protein
MYENCCRCCLEDAAEKVPLDSIYEKGTIIELIESVMNYEVSE